MNECPDGFTYLEPHYLNAFVKKIYIAGHCRRIKISEGKQLSIEEEIKGTEP